MIKNNLPSLNEYKKSCETNISNTEAEKIIEGHIWSTAKFRCPSIKCSNGIMRKKITRTITSYPVKYEYSCDKCGHVEYLDF